MDQDGSCFAKEGVDTQDVPLVNKLKNVLQETHSAVRYVCCLASVRLDWVDVEVVELGWGGGVDEIHSDMRCGQCWADVKLGIAWGGRCEVVFFC